MGDEPQPSGLLYALVAAGASVPEEVSCLGGCEDGVPIRKLSFGFFTADNDFTQAPVYAAHLQWRGTIGCSNDAATESGPEVAEGYRYSCEQGANVVWRKYKAGSHDWPSGDRGADVRNRMWQLFQNHSLP
ncbi:MULTISPECIES: hypothetical protein [Nocardia]|uniref:Uncharacterized protein n=2 Tax=Nocardia TaxID=1817 RepID=A0A2T2YU42_9NOCA|nr:MULTISPECIES: hypothetical protein [Nocardia]MBF6446079.1 hypothetical protein [Nocardia elegans]PSR59034.1 hypothetical protein C8259_28215 [Nocardia nova]